MFAGLSLEGARVNTDKDANRRAYGRDVVPDDILFGPKAEMPPAARDFLRALPASP